MRQNKYLRKDYFFPHLNCLDFPLPHDFHLKNITLEIRSLFTPLAKLVTLVKLFNILEHSYDLYNGDDIKGSLGKLNEVIYVDGSVQCLASHTMTGFIVLLIMHFGIVLAIIAFILFKTLLLSNLGSNKGRYTVSIIVFIFIFIKTTLARILL